MTSEAAAPGMRRSLISLILAEVMVMSLWFSAAAVLPALASESGLTVGELAGLSTAVQIGFVLGALVLAITGLPDRMNPRLLFAVSAMIAAGANLVLLVVPADTLIAQLSRCVVGMALAGVYPVGMKIAVGWTVARRGLLVAVLVSALTLGSAAPHLVALLGGSDWRLTLIATSVLAGLGAIIVLNCQLGPFHGRAARFDPTAIRVAWTNIGIRRAYMGYFGHMWELYALWAWIGTAATLAATEALHPDPKAFGSTVAFVAIALGGLACIPAGWCADRFGKAAVARTALIGSALSAIASAFAFGGPLFILVIALIAWGITVIPDSAQFSALVADHSASEMAGSLMTFQTAIGFALSAISVQAVPFWVEQTGWHGTFLILAFGPILGAIALGRRVLIR